jgi:quercetin dioxygenase-like cupin family protein
MEATTTTLGEMQPTEFPWGSITWLVSGEIVNSATMTFGRVVIRRGCSNEEHSHPNCDDILRLLQGELDHAAGPDRIVRMKPGDTIVLPAGTKAPGHVRECRRCRDGRLLLERPQGSRAIGASRHGRGAQEKGIVFEASHNGSQA